MSNPIRKLAGQTAVYGLSSIVGRLLNYLLVPLYTYKFTNAADYGVVSELYAWVAFLVVLLTFGMETAYFRFRKENTNEKEVFASGFFILTVINLLFLAAIFLFNQSIISHEICSFCFSRNSIIKMNFRHGHSNMTTTIYSTFPWHFES